MPLVEVTLRKGKSQEYIRSVLDEIHEALVRQAGVPADDRFQIVHQVAAEGVVADPSYAGMSRSADLIIIRITLNAGRTVDVKKKVYGEIAARLGAAVDARPDDVMIVLVEVARENWSFGKGLATYG